MKILYIIFVVFFLFASSCKEKNLKINTGENKINSTVENPIPDTLFIAEIGSFKISEQTLQYRLATESAYENTGLNKTAALIMTINDVLEMEIAKKYNQQAKVDEIEQFKQHADQTSKAPEILKKIKNVFGQDIHAYDLWYISPKIVNRKIRDYFSANNALNQASLNKIKPALNMLRSGKKMKNAAKLLSLTYATDSIPVKPLDLTPVQQNYPDAGLPLENPLLKYIKKIKPGEIYPDIIQENYSFMIIKVLNLHHDKYFIERISVPKPDFDTWFRNEAAHINIIITDTGLKQEIKNNYSNLWWVRYLN